MLASSSSLSSKKRKRGFTPNQKAIRRSQRIMEKSPLILELPTEILLQIFNMLDYFDLMIVRQTCAKFLELTNYVFEKSAKENINRWSEFSKFSHWHRLVQLMINRGLRANVEGTTVFYKTLKEDILINGYEFSFDEILSTYEAYGIPVHELLTTAPKFDVCPAYKSPNGSLIMSQNLVLPVIFRVIRSKPFPKFRKIFSLQQNRWCYSINCGRCRCLFSRKTIPMFGETYRRDDSSSDDDSSDEYSSFYSTEEESTDFDSSDSD